MKGRFTNIITSQRNFKNPYACHNMALQLGIVEHMSLLHDLRFPENQNYESMRKVQNQNWAEQRLQRGVEYAKEGKMSEAIRCYGDAIELVPTFAEAYTAKGAA